MMNKKKKKKKKKKKRRRGRNVDHLCSDGISDKSNHPQLNNQNNVTIALQIKCAIGRRRRRRMCELFVF